MESSVAQDAAALRPAAELRSWERWVFWGAPLLILCALSVAVYLGTLRAGFVYDDQELITHNEAFLKGTTLEEYAAKNRFRQELLRSYKRDLRLSGGKEPDPMIFHAANVLTHAAVVALVYGLLLLLGRRLEFSKGERLSLAVLGTTLFALHPIQSEAVAFVTGRADLLATFYLLAALAVFFVPLHRRPEGSIELFGRGETQPPALHSLRYWPLALGCWMLTFAFFTKALLCKELAAVLPALIVGVCFFAPGRYSPWRPAPIMMMGLLFATVGAAVAIRVIAFGGLSSESIDRSFFQTLGTNAWMVWRYLGIWLLPVNQSVDHDVPIESGLLAPHAFWGSVGILGLLALAWSLRRKAPEMGLGIVWFLLSLAPTTSVVAITDVFVERRLYLPSLGLCVLVAGGLVRLRRKLAQAGYDALLVWGRRAFVVGAGMLLLLTAWRTRVWANEVTLWIDAAKKAPNKSRPFYNLGTALLKAGEPRAAAAALSHLFKENPNDVRVHMNVGNAFLRAGMTEQALWMFRNNVLTLDPDNAEARYNMAVIYEKRGDLFQADKYLKEALRLDPDMAPAYVKLGIYAFNRNEPRVAVPPFERAVQLDPDDPVPYRYLALIYSEFLVDNSKAERYLRELLRLEPDNAQNLFNVAVMADRAGRYEEARDMYQKVLETVPGHVGALANLGALFERRGYRSEACRYYRLAAAGDSSFIPLAERTCAAPSVGP